MFRGCFFHSNGKLRAVGADGVLLKEGTDGDVMYFLASS